MGLSAYPTGIIDRVSGVQSRSVWNSYMQSRNSIPATVAIDLNRSYNAGTREFNSTVNITALQNLTGEFKYNIMLLEDGIVWTQNGSLGGPNYVHDWTVRAMMNGALG
ncbi:MAG: Omp28-related outer membrane protein, partial [Calditrichia bacterium]